MKNKCNDIVFLFNLQLKRMALLEENEFPCFRHIPSEVSHNDAIYKLYTVLKKARETNDMSEIKPELRIGLPKNWDNLFFFSMGSRIVTPQVNCSAVTRIIYDIDTQNVFDAVIENGVIKLKEFIPVLYNKIFNNILNTSIYYKMLDRINLEDIENLEYKKELEDKKLKDKENFDSANLKFWNFMLYIIKKIINDPDTREFLKNYNYFTHNDDMQIISRFFTYLGKEKFLEFTGGLEYYQIKDEKAKEMSIFILEKYECHENLFRAFMIDNSENVKSIIEEIKNHLLDIGMSPEQNKEFRERANLSGNIVENLIIKDDIKFEDELPTNAVKKNPAILDEIIDTLEFITVIKC